MSLPDAARTSFQSVQARLPRKLTAYQWALIAILIAAIFTRFWRLGSPNECYFDEVYFPTTGAEILHGDNRAWLFYGHENTHPPLSKEFMALGMGVFGHQQRTGADNKCWGDEEDAAHRSDPDWTYNPYAWRFFGALAGVGAVLFMYLLAKRLFSSEIAGLAGAFLLTFDGLAFAQSRIATPDTYVLFFVLGAVYFLVSNRFLFSGVFFGAAVATKWVAAFTAVPILLYFIWRLLQGISETKGDGQPQRLRPYEIALPGGLALLYGGITLTVWRYVATTPGDTYDPLGGPLQLLALLLVIAGAAGAAAGLLMLLTRGAGGGAKAGFTPRGKLYLQLAVAFGVFFVMVPGYVYLMTYLPMLLNGWDLGAVRELNRQAYSFHSNLTLPHPWQSPWDTWPIMARPIFLFVDSQDPNGTTKIYSQGNPIVFWMALPALAFVLWQGLGRLRARVDAATGDISVSGRISVRQFPQLFVVLGYLGFWLPWASQPRIMFIYHYISALAFAILALAYVVDWLWWQEDRRGRAAAVIFLVAVLASFVYFYPHLAAVDVPAWLDQSYYWFNNGLLKWQ
ncbi:MAG: phospholipid carrier-dependent glycosyltransferase [Dehalococcoidia bacterium]|nr:phospholipid carrier-dependent glycosyltransferase [Dehalococcoidia bacterium]